MNQYTFTDEQLFDLLQSVPELFREYVQAHGYEPEQAAAQAANDTIEGLIAERELFDNGEIAASQLTQVYSVTMTIDTVQQGATVIGATFDSL